ncbi:site-specific integrase [Streptomyces sp. NPDC019990]|uniref:site-specific integrase n=1 Tax=Streptomyces sp. NPDC019990 TaxID=3154693 RepID=UPI0033F34AAE
MGTKREIEPLTAKEGRQLLAAARDNRLWAASQLAVRIGLRRGELLGLRWSDVDLHEGVLTVRQALQRVGGELLIVAPKTQRSARRVALPSGSVSTTCVTRVPRCFTKGADARMIMEVLGHSSIRVTMDIYTFVRLDSQRSAFDRVGDALRGDGNDPDDGDGAAGVPVAI